MDGNGSLLSTASSSGPAERLSDIDIALYALYLLGGWQKRVHTEDVALKCFELAPTRFSWVKHPELPDPTPTRHALEHAKNRSDGAPLVTGASERTRSPRTTGGWRLTEDGLRLLTEQKARIEALLGRRRATGSRLPAERRIRDLRNTRAFAMFLLDRASAEVSHAQFAESLVCTVNSPSAVLNERLDQLATIAEQLQEPEVADYVGFCRRRFADLLGLGG
jgi:hypothetical protein